MSINLIACIDKSRGIGSNGSLLTKPPLDFSHFKELTMGNIVVFGKNTFAEIGKPLHGRHNIVLSKQDDIDLPSGVYQYKSINKLLKEYTSYSEGNVELFICGGTQVYRDLLPYANCIYLTIVDNVFPESDRFFPEFPIDEWRVVSNVKNEATEEYPYDYYFVEYHRK